MDSFDQRTVIRRFYNLIDYFIAVLLGDVMTKNVGKSGKRIERFKFREVEALRKRLEIKPELKDALRRDFEGTLKAEGVKVDREFLESTEREWRSQISRDIQSKVVASPGKYPLLSRVEEGKAIRVHVTVECKGRITKTKGGGD
jgi:hypothetical protein